MEQIKEFLKSKVFETACWQATNVLLAGAITYLTGVNTAYAIALIPVLNFITKYINTTYLK